MTPPLTDEAGRNAAAESDPAAVSSLTPADLPPAISEPAPPGHGASPHELSIPAISIIAKRADFLRAAQARRQGTPGFLVQARMRNDGSAAVRVGFTCSKKIGNAVLRNRAKRRLRAIARAILPNLARPGWDYVLVGRPGATVSRDYAALEQDLATALGQIHREDTGARPGPASRTS